MLPVLWRIKARLSLAQINGFRKSRVAIRTHPPPLAGEGGVCELLPTGQYPCENQFGKHAFRHQNRLAVQSQPWGAIKCS